MANHGTDKLLISNSVKATMESATVSASQTVANIIRVELQNHDIVGVPLNDFKIKSNHLIDRATAYHKISTSQTSDRLRSQR